MKIAMHKIRGAVIWVLLFVALALLGRKVAKPEEKTLTWEEMETLLQEKFKNLSPSTCFVVDEKYYIPTLQEVQEFIDWWLQWIKSKAIHYQSDIFDCDNFSLLCAAMASIMAKFHLSINNSQIHSYNLITHDNNEVELIEPQSGRIFSPEDFDKEAKKIISQEKRKGTKIKDFKFSPTELRSKVKSAVYKASIRTIGQPFSNYVKALFNEFEQENIGRQLENTYNTVWVYYT